MLPYQLKYKRLSKDLVEKAIVNSNDVKSFHQTIDNQNNIILKLS